MNEGTTTLQVQVPNSMLAGTANTDIIPSPKIDPNPDHLEEMHIFYSKAPTMGLAMPDSTLVHFLDSKYATNVPEHISYMERTFDKSPTGRTNFYWDPKNPLVNVKEYQDSAYALRQQIRREVMAELAATGDPMRDMGSTDRAAPLKTMNSSTIRGMTDGTGAVQATQVAMARGMVQVPTQAAASPTPA